MNIPFSKTISRLNLFSTSMVIVMLTICLSIFFTIEHYQQNIFHKTIIRKEMYDAKKHYIKNVVYRTISDLQHDISLCNGKMNTENELSNQTNCTEKELKASIKNRIRHTQLLEDGYIWINEVLNYNGGDEYAIRIVHPNLIETEGVLLSTSMQDIKGNTPYLTELEGIKKSGEVFFGYWFKKMDSDKISQKLTFAKLYKPYNWIIATGVYLDDIEELIAVYENEIESEFHQSLLIIILTGLVAALIAFFIARLFNRKIITTINMYDRENAEKERIIKEINADLEERVIERTRQIEKSRKALDSSNKRYQNLFHNSPVPLWEEDFTELYQCFSELRANGVKDFRKHIKTDPSFLKECSQKVKILDVNQEALKLHDANNKDELLGNLDKIFTEKSLETFQEELVALSEGFLEFESEGEIKSLAGRTKSIFLKMIVFKLHDKSYKAFLATIDITDRNQMEKRLKQSQKMESIGNLAGGIAHDFNNILSSIIGFSELALGAVKRGSEVEDDLMEIHTGGMRAKDLVKQILLFARQSDDTVKPLIIDPIAREALSFIRSSISANIEIIANIENRFRLMGNSTQIYQLFLNLFTNASHAMVDGGVLKVDISDIELEKQHKINSVSIDPGKYIKIVISDTGKGIPEEIIGFIFDPYYTTKSHGEGTGIGLAVVHGIIENYKGKIFVESEVGKGTKFTIYLPITKEKISEPIEFDENLPTGTESILFVDDESALVKMGDRYLSSLGYAVETCTNSIDALKKFRDKNNSYDLIISDMAMPKISGDQLAQKILDIKPDIPVIICTGYSNKMNEQIAKSIGIKALMIKPVGKTEMAKTVRNVLNSNRS